MPNLLRSASFVLITALLVVDPLYIDMACTDGGYVAVGACDGEEEATRSATRVHLVLAPQDYSDSGLGEAGCPTQQVAASPAAPQLLSRLLMNEPPSTPLCPLRC